MPQSLGEILRLIRIPSVVSIIHIVSVIVVGSIILRIVDSTLKRLPAFFGPVDSSGRARAKQRTDTLRQIVRSISRAVLILVVLLSIGDELGYNIQPILAGAGIVGLAVGFGA